MPFMITLEAARVNAKLTQQGLADMLKLHRTTIHNWETGKSSPDVVQLRRISEITRVPIDYIFLPDSLPKVNPTQ